MTRIVWFLFGTAAAIFVIFNVAHTHFSRQSTELRSFARNRPGIDLRLAALDSQIRYVSRMVAMVLAIGLPCLLYALAQSDASKILSVVAPAAAALYFLYQVVAGSMFATVSVTATATRLTDGTNRALLSVKLERGDKWVVDVPLVTYLVQASDSTSTPTRNDWLELDFPRRNKNQADQEVSWLRLGPGEKTDTMQIINLTPSNVDLEIDLRADSYAVWWPLPSQALTRVIVPAASASAPVASPANGCPSAKEGV